MVATGPLGRSNGGLDFDLLLLEEGESLTMSIIDGYDNLSDPNRTSLQFDILCIRYSVGIVTRS